MSYLNTTQGHRAYGSWTCTCGSWTCTHKHRRHSCHSYHHLCQAIRKRQISQQCVPPRDKVLVLETLWWLPSRQALSLCCSNALLQRLPALMWSEYGWSHFEKLLTSTWKSLSSSWAIKLGVHQSNYASTQWGRMLVGAWCFGHQGPNPVQQRVWEGRCLLGAA